MTDRFEAAMFDMDGVLVATEPLKALAHASTARSFGGRSNSSLYADVMGSSFDLVRTEFLRSAAVGGEAAAYATRFRETYEDLLKSDLQAMPGAIELVEFLSQRMPLAIVSSSNRRIMDLVLRDTDLASKFQVSISSDDVLEEKPSPQPYLLAAGRLGVASSRSVVFEDSDPGITAALAAGCRVIGVRHSLNRSHAFEGVAMEVQSLAEFDRIQEFLWGEPTEGLRAHD
jgi:HAD superfamily hydrolase (TIGR01509 family)